MDELISVLVNSMKKCCSYGPLQFFFYACYILTTMNDRVLKFHI